MITPAAFAGLVQQVPGLWGFALAALALILSPVPVVWVSLHRRSVLLARVEKDKLQVRSEHEVRMRELENEAVARMNDHAARMRELENEAVERMNDHAARMFSLETDRQQMLLEAQLQRDFMLAEHRQIEIDWPLKRTRRPQITAPETQGAEA